MQALKYTDPGQKQKAEAVRLAIPLASEVLIKLSHATRTGVRPVTKSDRAACQPGSVLDHLGVGVVAALGPGHTNFKPGDRVIISRITACGHCASCRHGMYAYCEAAGWILSSRDQAETEFVWMPYGDDEAMVILSDIQPGNFAESVPNGKIQLSEEVAIIGAGPIGLTAMLARCAARQAEQIA